MTDDSVPKREQWWWSEEQMRGAGWSIIEVPAEGATLRIWYNPHLGAGRYKAVERRTGEGLGAWLCEAPPPKPDKMLHEIARELFQRQSRRCMVDPGSDKPFKVDVEDEKGGNVVSVRETSRERAALALIRAYVEDHNGLRVTWEEASHGRLGTRYELRFVRVASGQLPYHQQCFADTLQGLAGEVRSAVERLAPQEMTDERIGWVAQRVGGHEANGDQERWVARVLESLREWRRCRRQYGPTSEAAKVAGVNLDNVLSTPPERTR